MEAILHKLKNPTGEETGKHVGRLQTDMNSFAQAGDIGMEALGNNMLAIGGPQLGADLAATLGKITNLVQQPVAEPSDDDCEPEGKDGSSPSKKRKKGEAPEGSPDKGKEKESKWWNKAAYQIARDGDIKELLTILHGEGLDAQVALKK